MKRIGKTTGYVRPHTVRGYDTRRDRNHAISMLRKLGFNHFVCFVDVSSSYALTAGVADWVSPNSIYVDR